MATKMHIASPNDLNILIVPATYNAFLCQLIPCRYHPSSKMLPLRFLLKHSLFILNLCLLFLIRQPCEKDCVHSSYLCFTWFYVRPSNSGLSCMSQFNYYTQCHDRRRPVCQSCPISMIYQILHHCTFRHFFPL